MDAKSKSSEADNWLTIDTDGRGVHVLPADEKECHPLTNDCLCGSEVSYIDPDTGLPYPNGPLVIHERFLKQ